MLIAVWLSIWGFAKIRRGIPSEPMIVFQFPMFFVVFGSIILFFGLTFLLSDLLSKNEYIPILLQNQRKLYQREKMYLATGGLRDEEQGRADLQVPESTRKKRLADVTSTLNQIGALLDIPRKQDENDQRYLERLGVFFERKKN